jgi:hypothetical protein
VIDHDDLFDVMQRLGDVDVVPESALEDGNLSDTAASDAPASDTWS